MTDPDQIDTLPYKLTPATIFKTVAGAVLPAIIATSLIVLSAGIIMGVIFDLRILLIAMIVVMLIAPFIIANIYFSRLLTPEARKALSLRRITIIPDRSIDISYLSEDEDRATIDTETIQWHQISSIQQNSKRIIFSIRDRSIPLIVPIDSVINNPDKNQ